MKVILDLTVENGTFLLRTVNITKTAGTTGAMDEPLESGHVKPGEKYPNESGTKYYVGRL